METNFVILIPSRIGSTRLRKKPLIDINGMSLIERVYKNSIAISNNSYIATDSDEILNHAQTFTKNVISTNNKHISGTDRIFEAAKKLKIDDETLIINLQGDEPFMPIDLVNQLINDFNNNDNVVESNNEISITSDGSIYINEIVYNINNIKEIEQAIFELDNQSNSIILSAEATSLHIWIVGIMDILNKNGFNEVQIRTIEK